jgi:NADH-quinone oxidoreductase subunit H
MDLSTTNFIGDLVREYSPYSWVASIVNGVIAIVAIMAVGVGPSPMLIWWERKVAAFTQARLGPMRVGPWGLLQTVCDVIKLLFKELITPHGADKLLFFLAPALPLTGSFLVLAVIPWDHNLQVANPGMGVPFIIAVSSLGILGTLLAGWSSNNKFSLLGALRCGAQMISYEVSLSLIMLFVVLMSGSADVREIVLSQQGNVTDWWIIKAPFLGIAAFVMYMISATAELNRGPFDMSEAEQELTAGFHTEYSSTAFAMFFLAEYINMVATSALASVFFLGGFLPFAFPDFGFAPIVGVVASINGALAILPGFFWMAGKILFLITLFMFFRWTYPRPRVDQLMSLEWKFLLPANLILLGLGAVFIAFGLILP